MNLANPNREFTGRHMLAIMVAFFSVIITVNLTMAFLARSSWTGFVAENTHVASRQFNAKMAEARAQAALGWKSELAIANGKVSYRLIDKAGNAVAAKRATANFRRPAYAAEDQDVALVRQPDGLLSASVELRDGIWSVEIQTEVDTDRPYRETRRLTLRNGVIQ